MTLFLSEVIEGSMLQGRAQVTTLTLLLFCTKSKAGNRHCILKVSGVALQAAIPEEQQK